MKDRDSNSPLIFSTPPPPPPQSFYLLATLKELLSPGAGQDSTSQQAPAVPHLGDYVPINAGSLSAEASTVENLEESVTKPERAQGGGCSPHKAITYLKKPADKGGFVRSRREAESLIEYRRTRTSKLGRECECECAIHKRPWCVCDTRDDISLIEEVAGLCGELGFLLRFLTPFQSHLTQRGGGPLNRGICCGNNLR